MSNRPNFDDDFLSGDSDFDADFFEADSLDADEPAFAGFDDDEIVIPDDEGGGTSRTFVLAGIMIAFLFVIILAIVVALLISSGGDPCGENCQLATEISATNFARETSISASQTAIALEGTIAEGTRIAAVATSTQIFIEQATGTQVAINTSVAGTATQISVDATATQAQEFDNRTATANAASPTPSATVPGTGSSTTDTPIVISGQLVDPLSNQPAPGVMLCVFLDDGDGVFNPASDSPPNCQLILTGRSSGTAVPTTSGAGTQQAPVAVTITPTTGAPAGTTPTRAAPPPPTAEGGAFNPALYVPVGRNSIEVLQQTTVTVTPTIAATATTGVIATTDATATTGATAATGTIAVPTGPAAQQQLPSPTAETGDQFITEIITDEQGNFILRGLPPGNYFIVIGDETIPIEIIQSSTPYLLVVPLASGESVTFLVDNISPGGSIPTLTITPTPSITPEFGTGGPIITTSPTEPSPTALSETGLFDGKGDDVTGTDLIILLLAGGILMGVVVTARRLRSNT